MIKLALTGNIAAGKSEVEKIFKSFKIPTLSADEVVHSIIYKNEKIINSIKKEFKTYDIITENKIDRIKLGNIVFSNSKKKKELEKIIHPFVIEEIKKFFEKEIQSKIVVVDFPLLFECHFEYLFDKILIVCADEKTRFERIKKRNNYEDNHIHRIIKSQINQEEKKIKSDFVVINENKTLEELKKDIEKIIKELK